jgi:hypothetical protein
MTYIANSTLESEVEYDVIIFISILIKSDKIICSNISEDQSSSLITH